MDLMIRGRKAIVAGGSAGMGKAVAEVLAREGVEVVLGARTEVRLRAVAAQMAQETGATVTPVAGDHGTIEGRAALAAACPEPDILVITVSPPPPTPDYRDIEPDDWGAALATNLVGPIELVRMFVPGMCDRRFGRVVNIATVAAKFPVELRLLSGAPRAALMNYTAACARQRDDQQCPAWHVPDRATGGDDPQRGAHVGSVPTRRRWRSRCGATAFPPAGSATPPNSPR